MDLEIEEIQVATAPPIAPVVNASDFFARDLAYEVAPRPTSDQANIPTPEVVNAYAGARAEVLQVAPPCRPMTWPEFAEWALFPSVRNSQISSVTWWTATDKRGIKRTFIILHVPCRSPSAPASTSFDIWIQPQRKRVAGWHTLDVSIKPSVPLDKLSRGGKLVLGLLDSSERDDHNGVLIDVPDGLHSCPGFRDVLDDKWRGAPPTLGHVIRFVHHIQELGPPFFWSPTHPSCCGFCRLLIHAIALRHYSFRQVVAHSPTLLQPRGITHDPSMISCVLLLLILQEQWQPPKYSKVIARILIISRVLGLVIVTTGIIMYFAASGKREKVWRNLGLSLICAFAPSIYVRYSDWARPLRLSSRTRNFLHTLDQDKSLTPTLGRRGPYIPSENYLQDPPELFLAFRSEHWTLELPGPRATIPPWRYLEQNYEYLSRLLNENPLTPAVSKTAQSHRQTTANVVHSIDNNRAQSMTTPSRLRRGERSPLLPTYNNVLSVSYRPDGRKRLLWLSKAVPQDLHLAIQSDGFALGTMSDEEFFSWVMTASAHVRNAVVRDVTWWSSLAGPFHHQFTVLVIDYLKPDGSGLSTYEIKAERHGKGRNIGFFAEHRITISRHTSLHDYEAKNFLILGLIAARCDDEEIHGAQGLSSSFYTCDAFRDALDEKWRGPPATLGHVARYIHSIVQVAPRYNLTSTNCYLFARLLFHSIALRHHSFSRVAAKSSDDLALLSVTHDPSAIGSVFRVLTREERESNGILFYQILFYMAGTMAVFILLGSCLLAFILSIVDGRSDRAIIWGIVLFPFEVRVLQWVAWSTFRGPVLSQGYRVAARTEKLAKMLDDDVTLTHPNGKRGQYPLARQYITEALALDYWSWELPGPRAPIAPWDYPEQEFANLPTFYDGQPVEFPMNIWDSV